MYQQSCAQTAVKGCDRIFAELISSMEKRCGAAKKLIKAQVKSAVAESVWMQLQLEEEITKLKKRDAELEQLSHVDDHIYLIQVTDI